MGQVPAAVAPFWECADGPARWLAGLQALLQAGCRLEGDQVKNLIAMVGIGRIISQGWSRITT